MQFQAYSERRVNMDPGNSVPRRSVRDARAASFCAAIVALFGAAAGPARAQSVVERANDCGADICLEAGVGNWRYAASQYCESGVCLRDRLASLVDLNWDRMTAGRQTLFSRGSNPYAGLDNAAYQRLRNSQVPELAEQVAILGTAEGACVPAELRLRLDVPGYDVVEVTFQVPPAADGETGGFQVTQLRRTYRSLPGGSVGWWVRWISNRFPGIPLLDGEPREFASYEIGLYMGGLVLTDVEFVTPTREEMASQPACR